MSKARDAIQHTAANLLEVSLTPYPAYATAGVSSIREEEGETMSDTIESAELVSVDQEAREAVKSLREEVQTISAKAFISEAQHPLAVYRSFGEYSKAVLAGEVESRALADQITTNNPGVLPPNWMLDVKNIVDLGRPGITAFGVESAGTSGMEFAWPYFDGTLALIVEEQTTEKTEVNSVRIDIKKGHGKPQDVRSRFRYFLPVAPAIKPVLSRRTQSDNGRFVRPDHRQRVRRRDARCQHSTELQLRGRHDRRRIPCRSVSGIGNRGNGNRSRGRVRSRSQQRVCRNRRLVHVFPFGLPRLERVRCGDRWHSWSKRFWPTRDSRPQFGSRCDPRIEHSDRLLDRGRSEPCHGGERSQPRPRHRNLRLRCQRRLHCGLAIVSLEVVA